MAGFRKDKTTAAQTAANAAAEVVKARIQSGDFGNTDAVNEALLSHFDALFGRLGPVVESDNALFEATEAAAPAASSAPKKNKPEVAVDPNTPGDTIFLGGKFKNCTIKDVYEMDEETAKTQYKHPYGAGSTYITNYVATEKNTNETTRAAAQAFLASIKQAA